MEGTSLPTQPALPTHYVLVGTEALGVTEPSVGRRETGLSPQRGWGGTEALHRESDLKWQLEDLFRAHYLKPKEVTIWVYKISYIFFTSSNSLCQPALYTENKDVFPQSGPEDWDLTLCFGQFRLVMLGQQTTTVLFLAINVCKFLAGGCCSAFYPLHWGTAHPEKAEEVGRWQGHTIAFKASLSNTSDLFHCMPLVN